MRGAVWTAALWMLELSVLNLQLDAKRVVHIPTHSISHIKYHIKVGQVLHSLGHQVWVIVPDYVLDKGILDISNITVIPYKMSNNYEEDVMEIMADGHFSGTSPLETMLVAISTITKINDELLRNGELEQSIRHVHPDLIVIDNVPLVFSLTVLPYKLQVPFAMMGSVYDVHTMRIPYSSAVNGLSMITTSDNMTFLERVKSMLVHAVFFVYSPFLPVNLASTYAPEMPPISNSELMARAELWLVELDHILDYARPMLPNVKLIGGTTTGHAKPLPPQLQTFMDGATQGVVLVTFGASVLRLPKHLSDKLFQVFRDLPFKVVFRSNLTSPDPGQVWTSPWLPQNDVLGHPNTKLFVSHCGKNGQYEALFHAVPLVCNPLFADQRYNSERIRNKGFGEIVDLRSFSEDELLHRIVTVAQDPRYKLAISKASTLFRQQYGSPSKEAAKWLDHVMEYGGEYMRYAGQKIPLYQFLALDVFAFVFALGALSCALMYCCLKVVCRCCRRRKPKTD